MLNVRTFKVFAASLAVAASALVPAFAQGTTTLRNPLLPGVQRTPPGVPAAQGMPPPVGNGPIPVGVTRGMTGSPTLLPWMPNSPVNDIDLRSAGINIPVTRAVQTSPSVLRPSLTEGGGTTPGAVPGLLTEPSASTNTFNAAEQATVDPNAGFLGTAY
jgi:hypothetical protein